MSETTRVKGVVETVVTDDDVARVSGMYNTDAEIKVSKAVMKAYLRAKRGVCAEENARARGIVAMLRAKREGVADEPSIPDTNTPSTGGQASLFDY